MRSSLFIQALCWAWVAWRKHWLAWTILWFIFLAVLLLYFLIALVVGLVSPLLAILVYVVGCLLPSYVYGAFIQAGLQQHDHPKQIIEKHFFSYFSIGAAFDIIIALILLIIMVIGLSLITVPVRLIFMPIMPASMVFYTLGAVCIYSAYCLLYFYPYAIVDQHQRNIFKMTVLYAYHNRWYCANMTLVWFAAFAVNMATGGVAGFFVFPLLTLADVFVYKKSKYPPQGI